jgi:hypothetical protein
MPEPAGKLSDPEWRRARATKAAHARTTGTYHVSRVRELVKGSRAAQGLPPTIVDELTLGQVAELLDVQVS